MALRQVFKQSLVIAVCTFRVASPKTKPARIPVGTRTGLYTVRTLAAAKLLLRILAGLLRGLLGRLLGLLLGCHSFTPHVCGRPDG